MTDWKPSQLTSTELARQTEDLDVEVARVAQDAQAHRRLPERLGELCAETDQRKRLAVSHLESTVSHYPEDAS
jgi:hypothetical protein